MYCTPHGRQTVEESTGLKPKIQSNRAQLAEMSTVQEDFRKVTSEGKTDERLYDIIFFYLSERKLPNGPGNGINSAWSRGTPIS